MEAMVGLQNRWEHLSDYRTRTWITTFDHDMDSQMAFRDFNNAILMSPDLFKGDHARIKQQISTATTDDDLQTLVGFHIGYYKSILEWISNAMNKIILFQAYFMIDPVENLMVVAFQGDTGPVMNWLQRMDSEAYAEIRATRKCMNDLMTVLALLRDNNPPAPVLNVPDDSGARCTIQASYVSPYTCLDHT